ncbi:hypothetical protein [Streptomyces sp. NPDC051561]|uniref:hypothetical protein n=1 Tax=Streptomyces sp. NPDC051561 TaxID=3365658 RepID=UPI0037BAB670
MARDDRFRDPDQPFTVIYRFRAKGDPHDFEREFHEHSQFLRGRDGFAFLVTVRVTEQPNVYVHLGHWRSRRGFLRTVGDPAFLAQVRSLGPMAEVEADQAVSVRRVLHDTAEEGASNVVVTRAVLPSESERPAFERRFAQLGDQCAASGGFGGSDLLRSTVHPLTYTGLQWWRHAEDCDRALSGNGYRQEVRALSEIAALHTERTSHLAYQRAKEPTDRS